MAMTKAQKTERDEAIVQLKEWIKPGDTVYTVLDSVSRSGMQRQIRVVVPYHKKETDDRGAIWQGAIDFLHPNHSVALAIGARRASKGDGIIMGGCGMDMGFALVYELSHTLYGAGYKCLGKGACPSSYHNNHRDRIRCEGTRVHNPDGPDFGTPCWRPNGGFFGPRTVVRDDWPRSPRIDVGDGQSIPGHLLTVVQAPDDDTPDLPYVVCPVCQGNGDLPNPEGPERFDLVHEDGYALRHKWL